MITKISDHPILEAFDKVVPYLHIITGEKLMLGLNNLERCLKFYSGEADAGAVPKGEQSKVKKGSAAYDAMKSGEIVTKIIPKEVFGFPYKAIGIPVKNDQNQVVGSIGIGVDLGKQDQIMNMGDQIARNMTDSNIKILDIVENANESVSLNATIEANMKETLENSRNTDQILHSILKIAKKLHLLSINASIEAHRTGEVGLGFRVVAEEVGKLAEFSTEASSQAQKVMTEMQTSITNILAEIETSNSIIREEAQKLKEVQQNVQDLEVVSKELKEISNLF